MLYVCRFINNKDIMIPQASSATTSSGSSFKAVFIYLLIDNIDNKMKPTTIDSWRVKLGLKKTRKAYQAIPVKRLANEP